MFDACWRKLEEKYKDVSTLSPVCDRRTSCMLACMGKVLRHALLRKKNFERLKLYFLLHAENSVPQGDCVAEWRPRSGVVPLHTFLDSTTVHCSAANSQALCSFSGPSTSQHGFAGQGCQHTLHSGEQGIDSSRNHVFFAGASF